MTNGEELHVLPGLSAPRLIRRGIAFFFLAAALTPLLALEFAFDRHALVFGLAVWGSISVVAIYASVTTVRGLKKRWREVANGYTTITSIAADNPALYAVDAHTLEVLRGPATSSQ